MPARPVEVADMTNFHLGRHYDACSACLPRSPIRSRFHGCEALACMRDHLEPGGVLVVQPYVTPDAVPRSAPASTRIRCIDRRVKRIRASKIEDRRHRVHFHYTIEGPQRDPGSGGGRRLWAVHHRRDAGRILCRRAGSDLRPDLERGVRRRRLRRLAGELNVRLAARELQPTGSVNDCGV